MSNERTERLTYNDKVNLSEALLEKIQKLLALTSSPNENEAAVAGEMAMKLLAKHHLSMEDFTEQYKDKTEEIGPSELMEEFIPWKSKLLAVIAPNCFCFSYRDEKDVQIPTSTAGYTRTKRRKFMVLVGTTMNKQVAVHLFKYLCDIVPAITEIEFKKTNPYCGPGTADLWKNSFIEGVLLRLKERLESQREQIVREYNDSKSTAIVAYDPYKEARNKIDLYHQSIGLNFSSAKADKNHRTGAREAGYEAGGNISLNPAQQLGR